MLPIWTSAK